MKKISEKDDFSDLGILAKSQQFFAIILGILVGNWNPHFTEGCALAEMRIGNEESFLSWPMNRLFGKQSEGFLLPGYVHDFLKRHECLSRQFQVHEPFF